MVKQKKGFTIIELVVVMSVLSILVLLAGPRLMGSSKEAKVVNIKHDIKVAEDALVEYLIRNKRFPNEWTNFSDSELDLIANEGNLYSKEGLIDSVEEGNYKEVDKDYLKKEIKTKLNGRFFVGEDLSVYYENTLDYTGGSKDFEFDREIDENIIDESGLKIISYILPNGIYKDGDIIKGEIKVEGISSGSYKLDAIMTHAKASSVTIPISSEFDLNAGEVKTVKFSHSVVDSNRFGFYDLEVTINDFSTPIAKLNSYQSIFIAKSDWEYFYDNDFDEVEMPVIGGIGGFNKANIGYVYKVDPVYGFDYSSATVKIPKDDNLTGQIKTKLPQTYGTYEASIKVPDSDALLSGFFLYGEDKYDGNITYEIDLEILFYEGRWQLWATVFNPSHEDYKYDGKEPGVIFHKTMDLSFDPSEDYHNYRIDFYSDYISFTLDGNEFARWNDSFDYGDMYLYSGSFYTHWLSGEIETVEKTMEIDWVRRGYFGK